MARAMHSAIHSAPRAHTQRAAFDKMFRLLDDAGFGEDAGLCIPRALSAEACSKTRNCWLIRWIVGVSLVQLEYIKAASEDVNTYQYFEKIW